MFLTLGEVNLSGIKILLIEDGKDNQTIFNYVLSKAGASIDIADNGKIGVELALNGSFDLVLMDIQMPEMDGYKATRILREMRYPRPIVALTAHAMTTEKEKCLHSGFDDYISKPVEFSTLIDVVAKHVAREHSALTSTTMEGNVAQRPDHDCIDRFRAEHSTNLSASLIQSVQHMREACHSQQWCELGQLAHKVKGSCAVYGLKEMAELAFNIETLVTLGQVNPSGINLSLQKLEQYSRQI